MNLVIGQALGGRYEIIRHLGGGGFGTTFIAEDKHLPGNHRCVVKHLKPQATDPVTLQTARRLFDTEAQVLYKLGTHEQIPQLFAYFEENKEFYLVQELIQGHDLSQEITVGKSWDEESVISLLQDILEILEFVHQQNVIHRDINPRNLIRREQDGKLVLIDFGAVKQISTTGITGSPASFTVAIGTPGYRPSEQANGKPKLSSDIYAVGIIGIQALTGLVSNQLLTDADTGEIIWREQAKVSPELANVLDKMVRYDFRERYPSATEALQALKNLKTPTSATLVLAAAPLPAIPVNHTINIKYRAKFYRAFILTGLIGLGIAAIISIFNFINSSNATELYNQGNTLADLKRYEDALNAYKKAIDIKPDYLEAWTGRGKTLYDLKRYKEALEAYDKAIQIQTDVLEAWTGRGYVLDSLQRPKDAIDSFDKALQIKFDYPEAWNGKGNALINSQRYEEAIASYDKALQFKPDYYEAWYSRGWGLHNLRRYEEAIASYDKAIQFKSDYFQAWYNKGNSLVNLNKYREAVASYDKAVQFQPDYYQAWYSRGNALLNLRQYEEAADSFDRVINLQPSNYKSWYNRGWSLHQLQRYEQAIDCYDKAIGLKRNDYQAWYNRGNALYNLKRYEEAIASYNRAVRYKPDYYEALYSRGNGLFNLKRYLEAVAAYDKAIRYKPDYREAIDAKNRAQNQLDMEKLNLEQNQQQLKKPNDITIIDKRKIGKR